MKFNKKSLNFDVASYKFIFVPKYTCILDEELSPLEPGMSLSPLITFAPLAKFCGVNNGNFVLRRKPL